MKKKKGLLVLILLMAIGFAAVSTTLYINGTAQIGKNDDDFMEGLIFTDVSITEGATATLSDSKRTINVVAKDMSLVGDSSTLTYAIQNNSQYDAELIGIRCYFVDSFTDDTKEETEIATNDYVKLTPASGFYPTSVLAGGNKTETTTLTVEQQKSYVGESDLEIKFQCVIEANASESTTPSVEPSEEPTTPAKLYTLVNDNDADGEISVGDEINITGTEENFYVISNENGTINALAKYNLNVGSNAKGSATGLQDSEVLGVKSGSTTYGNVAFSNSNGWSYANNDDIDIQQYDGPVKSAINAYKAKLPEGTGVRLITKAELEGLGCDSSSKSCSGAPAWVYSTSYWSGSAVAGDANRVWYVISYGNFGYVTFGNVYSYGVRPVISLES